jgi:hypothetical protein
MYTTTHFVFFPLLEKNVNFGCNGCDVFNIFTASSSISRCNRLGVGA